MATSEPERLHRAKLAASRATGGGPLLSNVDWASRLGPTERARLPAIRRRPSRTLSGVAVVAVMTSPARCPHGRCTYCPGGVDLASPQSYTGEEPSALRGAQFHYDARRITSERLRSLEEIGHPTSKVEVIVMGGTFPARPRAYQTEVFKGTYDGLNGFVAPSLEAAQRANERAARRMVGLTVETRPDWCDERVLPFLLEAGVTRVEIGVETLRPDVLDAVGRAHGIEDVERASAASRAAGLKLTYHMMLGLPGMGPDDDVAQFERLFREPALRPDMLKIYPTLVLPSTPLYEEFRAGRYRPYDTETAVAVLARIKRALPPWVRVQRIQRDIPARLIAEGVRAGDLRERARRRLRELGERCRCLRCREVGRWATPDPEALVLTERRYEASGGTELFLGMEEPASEAIGGYLRLRLPPDGGPERDPIVRELKVLGAEVPIGASAEGANRYQHRGFGRALLERAEEIARQDGYEHIAVRSGVGTREYYARFGYARDGPGMSKPLR